MFTTDDKFYTLSEKGVLSTDLGNFDNSGISNRDAGIVESPHLWHFRKYRNAVLPYFRDFLHAGNAKKLPELPEMLKIPRSWMCIRKRLTLENTGQTHLVATWQALGRLAKPMLGVDSWGLVV